MEQKVVKFEIGKILAIVITIVVIAVVASVLLQSSYFKGDIGAYTATRVEEPVKSTSIEKAPLEETKIYSTPIEKEKF